MQQAASATSCCNSQSKTFSEDNSIKQVLSAHADGTHVMKLTGSLHTATPHATNSRQMVIGLYCWLHSPRQPTYRRQVHCCQQQTARCHCVSHSPNRSVPWQNFLSPDFGTNFRRELPLFWRYTNFLKIHCSIGGGKPAYKK